MQKTITLVTPLFFALCLVWVACEDNKKAGVFRPPEKNDNEIGDEEGVEGGDNESPQGGDTDVDSDSDTDTDADTDSDSDSDADEDIFVQTTDSVKEEVCKDIDFPIEPKPIRIMIVQDLSVSMRQGEQGGPTKWVQAKAAIKAAMEQYKGLILFGLDGFPNITGGPRDAFPDRCNVSDPVMLDVGKDQAEKVNETLDGITINNVAQTPLWFAMENFTHKDYAPVFTNGEFASYLLVVSDGDDTCKPIIDADGGVSMAVNQRNLMNGATTEDLGTVSADLAKQGINTFVIGFGDGISKPEQLDAIAKNGGTGMDTHLKAADEEALAKQLKEVIYNVISCTYETGKPDNDVDADKANFFFDGKQVGRDDGCAKGKGWTWTDKTMTAVEFCEAACKKLKNGKISDISAQFGCPSVPVQ